MTALRQVVATFIAGAGLWACTALSGVGDLEATEGPLSDGKDAAVATSSGAGGSSGQPTDAASSTSSSSTSSSSSSSSTSGDGGTDASSTSSSSGSTTSSSSSSSSSSSASSSSTSGTVPPTTFSDNFDRANSTTVGNSWTEKTDHFSISENKLLQIGSVDDGYYNIVAWTPLAATDVQVSYDVIFPPDPNFLVDPTVIVRAPATTVTQYNIYDGYTFYFVRNYVGIEREEAGNDLDPELDGKDIVPPLDVGVTYHATFQVTGTNPVTLTASIKDANGTTITTLSATDASASRFSASGRVGIGSSTDGKGLKWDNFVETQLTP